MSDIEANDPPPVLLPCTICSRTFRPEVLERHVKVCEKTTSKKRRVFDSFKSRVSGTELEEFLGPAPLPGQAPRRPTRSPVKKRAPSKWKETHENLIATLRAARGLEPPSDTMMEAPKPAGNEQCPSCNRYFGPRAFDRHVEFCKEKTARIKLMPSKVSQAQERLEARTKYRAPLSLKPKLTTKEKYSPMLSRKESIESCSVSTSSTKTSPPIPTLNRNLKPARQNSCSFSRQSPIRNSERQRSVSPLKKLVTSSKPNAKSEAHPKPINQPKIKENLKNSEDFRPRTGTKALTQEKIRRSYPKLTQLEDETPNEFKKMEKKKREKFALKITALSDNESVDSEKSENRDKQTKQSQKWSTVESLSKIKQVCKKKERLPEETEKIILDLTNIEKSQAKARTELKSGRKSKHQKPQINDLSVNDGSFGVFVAACSVRPPSSSASKTSLKTAKESPKIKNTNNQTNNEMKKSSAKSERKERPHSDRKTVLQEVDSNTENKPPSDPLKATKVEKTNKIEKISKIPKPKMEALVKKVEKTKVFESSSEVLSTDYEASEVIEKTQEISKSVGKDILHEKKIKMKTKKWRNIAEIPTEELVHFSEDFEITENYNNEELNESEIWEIAAEQFLKSDEPIQSISAFSVDSLTENYDKNLPSDVTFKKPSSNEDDLIVLHVADPAKLVENDADMKLSVSEPCFTYTHSTRKLKKKTPENKKVDIVVFTAFPSAIQSKVIRCRRKKERKSKKSAPPKLLHIREKTFLANDIPKPKRRKMIKQKNWESRFVDYKDFLSVPSKEEMKEKKEKFIEGLKQHKEKIRKWQIRANSHIRFMEEFQKSIENDLKELKNLSKGKKTIRRPCLNEFKKEKVKKLQEEWKKTKMGGEEHRKDFKIGGKKFAYFEINLMDKIKVSEGEVNAPEKKTKSVNAEREEKNLSLGCTAEKTNVSAETHEQLKSKKFECFEIANDSLEAESNVRKSKKAEINLTEKQEKMWENTAERFHSEMVASDSTLMGSHQNSSLENIEEVDESLEDEKAVIHTVEKDIEIENFILSKPNAEKILSKDDNCLEELFPKPRKSSDVMASANSAMAVKLDFTADSVYDLKSNEKKKLKGMLKISNRGSSTRILQKRLGKEAKLPQIFVKNIEQKENSLISLIEVWKTKKGSSENEQISKTKATLPIGKLPPLTNKNSFQIGANSNESYDPFKQAERQMLALLSWPSTADIKTAKKLSPSPKTKPAPQHISNLETSPTSAFSKYPIKHDKSAKNETTNAKKNLNETFAVHETSKTNSLDGKPLYAAADDWEQIFEKHFDLNRNEMTEQMTRSVKSALDGLLKSAIKNKPNSSEEEMSPHKSKDELTQNSIITEVLYTSTPKQNPKPDRNSKTRSKDPSIDLGENPNTYRKNSNFTYGRITPPEDFNDLEKTKKNDKNNRYSGISLSSLSFCSQISDTTLADEEVMRSNLEIIGKAAAAAAARSPRRKYARSQSVFDERNKMLFAKTYDPNCSSSDENDVEILPKIIDEQGKKSPSRNPNPKFSPSHFHRSQSVMDGKYKGDGDHSEGDHMSSPESNRNRKAKLSGDSAYSSLNRKSRQSTQKNQAQEDRLSSSGSEHSFPNIDDYEPKPKSLNFDSPSPPKKDSLVKMSKFCHECGSKYPVAVAKFCCECGVRRLII